MIRTERNATSAPAMVRAAARWRRLLARPAATTDGAWLILVLGVALRLLVSAVAIREPERYLAPDSQAYLRLAGNLAEGHGFSRATSEPWTPDTFRVPGYPAFIAAVSALLPALPVAWTVIFLQSAGLVVAGGALLWLTTRLGLPRSGAVASAAVMAFDPVAVGLSATVLSETLFTTLMVLALCAWILTLREGTRAGALCTGVLIGGLALVRPVALLFWTGPVLSLLAARRPWPRRAVLAGLVLVGYGMVVGPWALRNRAVGAGLTLSSMADSQLIYWQAAIVEARARGLTRSAVEEEYRHRYPSAASGIPVMLEVAQRYPGALVSSTGVSLLFFFLEPGHHVLLRPLGGGGTGLFANSPSVREPRGVGRGASLVVVGACLLWIVWLTVATIRGLWRARAEPPLRDVIFGPSLFSLAYFATLSVFVVLAEGARLRAPILPVIALLVAASQPLPRSAAVSSGSSG